jgi:acetyl/propionyl-CoA carboxylase alpha subunit
VTPELRRRMTDAAVGAAKASSYRNAGTLEFLVDLAGGRTDDAAFYFLEMNARLQVEHPVTELVAGVDLVRAQLLLASGEPLPWNQDDLAQRGHAIEARVYAEDPTNSFLPQAGRLLLYREPNMPGVRVDSGVAEGTDVGVHYDPLLAKVIAHGESRGQALARLTNALRAFPVLGIRTNIPFLLAILAHPTFVAGRAHTGFLDAEMPTLVGGLSHEPPRFVREAVAAAGTRARETRSTPDTSVATGLDPWERLRGWRL